jgi:glycosyltransferase involved in cell wall biosynthesis
MVGPWTKVDPETFPRHANLHWLGQRDYGQLPAYAKGFDVCLMPFALNEATEFINPTKALEYMATGRPIVSTAIEDVVLQFQDVVKIARTHDDFVFRCEREAAEPNQRAIGRGLKLAKVNSWESIVSQLEAHVTGALNNRRSMASDAA